MNGATEAQPCAGHCPGSQEEQVTENTGTHPHSYTTEHFSLAQCLLSNLLCARHCEAKRIQRRGEHVGQAPVSGFESPSGMMPSQWYLYSHASVVCG